MLVNSGSRGFVLFFFVLFFLSLILLSQKIDLKKDTHQLCNTPKIVFRLLDTRLFSVRKKLNSK